MPQSRQKSLLAQLPSQCTANPDDTTRFFVGWWLRMHEKPDPLVITALKFVEWATAGAAAERFLWEVCRWTQGKSSSWTFICWLIDGDGMWMRDFPSKRAAMAYFDQSPAIVLAVPDTADAVPPHKAAS